MVFRRECMESTSLVNLPPGSLPCRSFSEDRFGVVGKAEGLC